MTEPTVTIGDATRMLARGGGLDAQLDAFAAHARSASGARMVTIYLLDEPGAWLVPASTAGPVGLGEQPIELQTAPPAIAVALAERRTEVSPLTSSEQPLSFLPPGGGSLAAVPLVTAGADGTPEVDGLLLAVLDGGSDAPLSDALGAAADLAAIAIRMTRLENLLAERADWLDRVASTDPLTGLANRRTFERMLQLELIRAGRQSSPLGLVLVGIDGLADLRERSGEQEADGVMRRVAATLAQQLRLVDTVARIGPDTFAAICPGSPGPEAALRLRDAIAALAPASADPSVPAAGPTSVSVGVARFPEEGAETEPLIAAAEAALERARAQGPGSVVSPA